RIRNLIHEMDFDLLFYFSSGSTNWLERRERNSRELDRLLQSTHPLLIELGDSQFSKRLIDAIAEHRATAEALLARNKTTPISITEALPALQKQAHFEELLNNIPQVGLKNLEALEYRRGLVVNNSVLSFLILFMSTVAVSTVAALLLSNRLAQPLSRLAARCKDWTLGSPWTIEKSSKIAELQSLYDHLEKASERQNFQYEKLQEANAQLNEFSRIVSHDLKNPIFTVRHSLELLEDALPPLSERDGELLAIIKRTLTRMEALVKNLLAFAKLAESSPQLALVDMNPLVEEVLENLSGKIQSVGATVTVKDLPSEISANKQLVMEVLENLVSNALKYVGSSPPVIEISAVKKNDEWIFSVQDNGEGIPAESIPQLFDAFYRAPGHVSREGQGLGLSICKRIIELHGGRISVSSVVGKGSTFSFSIPATLMEASAHRAEARLAM
ncbi:MAG: HAMP domain-containing histidine kinase, partial [Bdellovibrionales bacterium]|nr:HAMP domain-containing histidine kinase [Bdellovibrionales bacterium]